MFRSTPLREGRRRDAAARRDVEPVSIHAPARGATCCSRPTSWRSASFDPRPCARGDLGVTRPRRLGLASFDPRPCARGDPTGGASLLGVIEFRSTPLREGRRRASPIAMVFICFDPRPCARGDDEVEGPCRGFMVSIHAPARGATTGGASLMGVIEFRSTPLREGRRGQPGGQPGHAAVSIHAPARGATRYSDGFSSSSLFRSTPLREGRPVNLAGVRAAKEFRSTPLREGRPRAGWRSPTRKFRSTPLREGRPGAAGTLSAARGFDPRPCARGDQPTPQRRAQQRVSIHAPARGATRTGPRLKRQIPCFDPRPCARGDA